MGDEINEDSKIARGNRRAVVTGAANGLGLAIARRLSADGAHVLLVDSDSAVLSRINDKDLPSTRTFALVKDLSEEDGAPLVFDQVAKTLGLADTLINNAAWSFHKPMLEVTVAEFDRVVGVNQRAPFFLAQEFLRHAIWRANELNTVVPALLAAVDYLDAQKDAWLPTNLIQVRPDEPA